MYLLPFTCAYCGKSATQPASAVNRAEKIGARLYCNRICAGLGRRKGKTKAQKVEEKRLYDAEYREKNREKLRKQKAEHYQATRDPEMERIRRRITMPRHVEYCRRPEYKKKKKVYDLARRAVEYGDFAESYILLLNTEHEIRERATDYEIRKEQGRLNNSVRRKRAAAAGTVALG